MGLDYFIIKLIGKFGIDGFTIEQYPMIKANLEKEQRPTKLHDNKKKYYIFSISTTPMINMERDKKFMVKNIVGVTGAEAGLSGDAQIRIALQKIVSNGGIAQISEIYAAIESGLGERRLSEQGKASLRRYINTDAVRAGYLYPYDTNNSGWRITPEGREFVKSDENASEQVFNVDTDQTEVLPSNTVRGSAFEQYIIRLLRCMYPHYTWYHQGHHKSRERGLDVIGNELGENRSDIQSIGVQVKFHAANTAPTNEEWLKFLAGCFARRLDSAVFITTGRLTSEQRREAGEARVIVIEGHEEITRIAEIHGIKEFELSNYLTDDQKQIAPR